MSSYHSSCERLFITQTEWENSHPQIHDNGLDKSQYIRPLQQKMFRFCISNCKLLKMAYFTFNNHLFYLLIWTVSTDTKSQRKP